MSLQTAGSLVYRDQDDESDCIVEGPMADA